MSEPLDPTFKGRLPISFGYSTTKMPPGRSRQEKSSFFRDNKHAVRGQVVERKFTKRRDRDSKMRKHTRMEGAFGGTKDDTG